MTQVMSDAVLAGSFGAVAVACLLGVRALARIAGGKPSKPAGQEPAESG
jgi:hypothetical protein